jgi:hypothetical protein
MSMRRLHLVSLSVILAIIAQANDLREGPWGTLRVSAYTLTMPLERATRIEFLDTGTWTLTLDSWAPFDALLSRLQLAAPDRSIAADGRSRQVRVSAAFRRGLDPAPRAELYRWLGAFPANRLHMLPYVLPDEATLGRAGLNPRMREALQQLSFARGTRTCLVDADLVAALADTPAERARLNQLLYRTTALSVELLRESLTERARVVDHWGRLTPRRINDALHRFERSTEVEAVDVLQLLPKGPRQVLNSYPDDLTSPAAANCMWLSLNFFEPELSVRFLPDAIHGDTTEHDARAELDAHYDRVETPWRFGDVLTLWADTPQASALVHVVVSIADDIVLTKNGLGHATPFVLAPLDDVTRRYAWIGELTLRAYRLRPVE